jgi:hypothetical protein
MGLGASFRGGNVKWGIQRMLGAGRLVSAAGQGYICAGLRRERRAGESWASQTGYAAAMIGPSSVPARDLRKRYPDPGAPCTPRSELLRATIE